MYRFVARLARLITIQLACTLSPAWAGVTTGTDEEAMLPYWQYQDEHISLRLVQRLPDQTRAFFAARGFKRAQTDVIARACVFQSIFKNRAQPDSHALVSYDLGKWQVVRDGKTSHLLLREDWAARWQAMPKAQRPSKPARIALEWSLLPTRQQYQPGDYNWGMSAYGLPPGTRFDLAVHWHVNGKARSARIPGVTCAPDVTVEPTR